MVSELMPVNEILETFDICKEMVLEVCNYTTDEQIAQFIITTVKERVSYLQQEENFDDGDHIDSVFKQGGC